jgi:hypothetical protein
MSALRTQDEGTIVLSQDDYLPIVVESFLVDRRAQVTKVATTQKYLNLALDLETTVGDFLPLSGD